MAFNGLDFFASEISNAYLQAPYSQKDFTICDPEFVLGNIGNKLLIRGALYGLKAAGCNFRNNMHECICHPNFESCPADTEAWMRPAMKDDGLEYSDFL